ncbi:hypothetical protein SAMN04489761_3291 [Tenacibaculum sp. MAR_2009_124]|uniref:mannosyltransferase n=1 Tax=Tenacibaculum sp. MAR_2009_124 TaxID=1250059 RepID=UPI000898AA29|nr:mannosyltransferase [Tenacibaculum sp. MAR_2009_124]SEC54828.1 hypothetical protein SAMN04489761_3291 [Tenacibaculum sp. MAR_2009_124]
MKFIEKHSSLLTGVILILYFLFAYYLERTSFYSLLALWGSLFTATYFLFSVKKQDFSYLAGVSILFRLVFLFSIPNLSQDFYRFIWDGRMLFEGFNPYLSLPETFIELGKQPVNEAVELYKGMGEMNGSHFTNYPPINQLCFYIASLVGNNSILVSVTVMHFLIIAADIGILFYGKKLLKIMNLPVENIFLYILNPFIIVELTGNLHFEPVMLFFLILSMYKLSQKKWVLSGIFLALSISVKLIPILFLPLFFKYFVNDKTSFFNGTKKLIAFYLVTIATLLGTFIPFMSGEFLANYGNSVGLWFRSFEFNASIYYLAREIGYLFRGYNEIGIIGKIIPLVAILFILGVTFFRKNKKMQDLITAMLLCLSFYYFISTTVHPWYLATLLILSVFTKYRFPLIWSFVIIFSYQAYANTPWKENLWFVFIEYFIVFLVLMYELNIPKPSFKTKLT